MAWEPARYVSSSLSTTSLRTPTFVLPSVHGMGPSKVRELVVDLKIAGVGPVVAYGSGSALLLL